MNRPQEKSVYFIPLLINIFKDCDFLGWVFSGLFSPKFLGDWSNFLGDGTGFLGDGGQSGIPFLWGVFIGDKYLHEKVKFT